MKNWNDLTPAEQSALETALTGAGALAGNFWRRLGPGAMGTTDEWSRSKVCADPKPADVDHAVSGADALAHFKDGKRIGLYTAPAKLLVIEVDLPGDTIDRTLALMEEGKLGVALLPPLCIERGGPNNRAHIFYRAEDEGGMTEVARLNTAGEMVGTEFKRRNYVAMYDPSVLATAINEREGFFAEDLDTLWRLNVRSAVGGPLGGGRIRSLLNERGFAAASIDNLCSIIEDATEGERHDCIRDIACYIYGQDRFDHEDEERLKESARSVMPQRRWREVEELFRTAEHLIERRNEEREWESKVAARSPSPGGGGASPDKPESRPISETGQVAKAEGASSPPIEVSIEEKPASKKGWKKAPRYGFSPGSILASGAIVLEDAMTSRSLDMAMCHIAGKSAGFRANVRTGMPEVNLNGQWSAMTDVIEGSLRDSIRTQCALVKEVKGEPIAFPASFSVANFRDALARLLREGGEYDPMLEWLKTLKWDGKPRIDTVFQRVFRLPANEAVAYASRNLFLRSVMRAREPGCECDSAFIVQGAQGIGKSTFFELLVPQEVLGDSTSACASLSLRDVLSARWSTATEAAGCVFVVLDEMTGATSANSPAVKDWVSRKNDDCRLPYERYKTSRKRRFVITGTANAGACLPDDPTGNRRWLILRSPIPNGERIDFDLVRAEREQWWAEAFSRTQGMTGLDLTQKEIQSDAVRAYFSSEAGAVSDRSSAYEALHALLSCDNYEKLKSKGWDDLSQVEWGEQLGQSRVPRDRDGNQVGPAERMTGEAKRELNSALGHFGFTYGTHWRQSVKRACKGFRFDIGNVADLDLRREIEEGKASARPSGISLVEEFDLPEVRMTSAQYQRRVKELSGKAHKDFFEQNIVVVDGAVINEKQVRGEA